MSVIPFAIEVAKLAIYAFIFWYVVEFLPMPEWAKRVCQLLIVFIAIMVTLQMVLADAPPGLARRSFDSMSGPPSIMAPEKR